MALDGHVELGRFEVNDHTSDFWRVLFSNKVRDVPVDSSSDDLFPAITREVDEFLRVEHGVDLVTVGNSSGVNLWLDEVAWSLHHHCLCTGWHLHLRLAWDWLLEVHALPLDLRHLVWVPVVLVAVPPRSIVIVVPPVVLLLVLLLSGFESSIDWLLELSVANLRTSLVVLNTDLPHDDSKRSNQ